MRSLHAAAWVLLVHLQLRWGLLSVPERCLCTGRAHFACHAAEPSAALRRFRATFQGFQRVEKPRQQNEMKDMTFACRSISCMLQLHAGVCAEGASFACQATKVLPISVRSQALCSWCRTRRAKEARKSRMTDPSKTLSSLGLTPGTPLMVRPCARTLRRQCFAGCCLRAEGCALPISLILTLPGSCTCRPRRTLHMGQRVHEPFYSGLHVRDPW